MLTIYTESAQRFEDQIETGQYNVSSMTLNYSENGVTIESGELLTDRGTEFLVIIRINNSVVLFGGLDDYIALKELWGKDRVDGPMVNAFIYGRLLGALTSTSLRRLMESSHNQGIVVGRNQIRADFARLLKPQS